MRNGMMAVGHADIRVGAAAELSCHLERDDAGDIGAVGQPLEIKHQLGMFIEIVWNPYRTFQIGRNSVAVWSWQPLSVMRCSISRTDIQVFAHYGTVALRPRSSAAWPFPELPNPECFCLSAFRHSLRRGPPRPNSRSKTTRGLFSIGSGMVGVRHTNVFMYTQL